tara:strand:+ start:1456 stop:1614 length:159 start_codon:yes stop_codon:yes gene_type:complete
MKIPNDRALVYDEETKRWRLEKIFNPKLDAAGKMRERKTKKKRIVRPGAFFQ